jgi:hypothetical protein
MQGKLRLTEATEGTFCLTQGKLRLIEATRGTSNLMQGKLRLLDRLLDSRRVN